MVDGPPYNMLVPDTGTFRHDVWVDRRIVGTCTTFAPQRLCPCERYVLTWGEAGALWFDSVEGK